MKTLRYTTILFFVFYISNAQNLIIKGKVKCSTQSVNSTKGAENIVVVPAFMPSKATVTTSQPSGYFEFDTGVPISKIQDKMVSVYVVSRCKTCSELPKRIFISEDQDRQNRDDNKRYVTIKEWQLNVICNKAELKPLAADSVMRLLIKQPNQDLDKVSNLTALTGAPAFLNFFTNLIQVVGVIQNFGTFKLFSLEPGKIKYGKFLMASPMYHSANTGFNFAPSRDISEAAFWNPSAISFNRKSHNISLLTNMKNNLKASGFYKINNKFSIATAGIFTLQDETRKAKFILDVNNIVNSDSTKMELKEMAISISPTYKVNNKLGIALTIKYIDQKYNNPNLLLIETKKNTFKDSAIHNQNIDFDISASLKINNALQLGINLMNLAGTTLNSDAFVIGKYKAPIQNQLSLGLGATYKYQRFNIGTDILLTKKGLFDASVGVNYVPFNNAIISAGYAIKQKSYTTAFRIKHFRVAYINDNAFLVNEQRKGKLSILNGQIYGGFIFDLD